MAIYKNSRYTNVPVYNRDGLTVFKNRVREEFTYEESFMHIFIEGDTLDGLALMYYGDSQLWWVILDANPRYRTPLDIPYGEDLIIPSYEEVNEL